MGLRPIYASAESPRAMPSQARPFDSTWTVAMAEAMTAGWRVAGLVAPVASVIFVVHRAAMARAAKTSPPRFCESVKASPSQPSSSAIVAISAMRPGTGKVPNQNSTIAWSARLLRGPLRGNETSLAYSEQSLFGSARLAGPLVVDRADHRFE